MKQHFFRSLIIVVLIISLLSCVQESSNKSTQKDSTTKNLNQQSIAKVEKLDTNLYEIIKRTTNPKVTNYYVLIKFSDFNKDTIIDFIQKFKNEFGYETSNVDLFDSKKAISLVDKEPLEGQEYIYVADHYIAMSIFGDAPGDLYYYPFQDYNYRDYGGKNWKVKPVK